MNALYRSVIYLTTLYTNEYKFIMSYIRCCAGPGLWLRSGAGVWRQIRVSIEEDNLISKIFHHLLRHKQKYRQIFEKSEHRKADYFIIL
jgi:hypothetical protein